MDAEKLLAEANRVMAQRRTEPLDLRAVSRMELDVDCLEQGDLDRILTQRHLLRALARLRRTDRPGWSALDRSVREGCDRLLALAPAYHSCVKALLEVYGLWFGDEGGMEPLEPTLRRPDARAELDRAMGELRAALDRN